MVIRCSARLWFSPAFVHVRTTCESLGTPELVQVSEIGYPKKLVFRESGPQPCLIGYPSVDPCEQGTHVRLFPRLECVALAEGQRGRGRTRLGGPGSLLE